MTEKEIKDVLEKHQHWLDKDVEGWENMRANLRSANLCGADLRKANLYKADLCGADLYRADLCEANLCEADLCGADLSKANLSGRTNLYRANLCGADLRKANLHEADLRETDLYRADLSKAYLYESNLCRANLYKTILCEAGLCEANLREANLCEANLCGASLCEADLHGANLYEADLRRADLRRAKNVPFAPYTCPDFGMFIGFKKAHNRIVVLEIPEDAKRLSATGRKCRCDKAKVLEIQNLDGSKSGLLEIASEYDDSFVYKIGKIVEVDNFDEDRWNECSTGIHFFINRQEAVGY